MAKVTLVEICRKYSGNDYRHTLPEQDKVTLGRDKENDIVIDHPFLGVVISRNHCTFIRKGDNIRVFDNDSKNGTFVEDKRLFIPRKLSFPSRNFFILWYKRKTFWIKI